MRYFLFVLACVLQLTVQTGALAAERAPDTTLARLQQGLLESNPNPAGTKLGAVEREKLARRQAMIREMIRKLESGQAVDPKEVDAALGEAAPWR
jgi:hypothetical protein